MHSAITLTKDLRPLPAAGHRLGTPVTHSEQFMGLDHLGPLPSQEGPGTILAQAAPMTVTFCPIQARRWLAPRLVPPLQWMMTSFRAVRDQTELITANGTPLWDFCPRLGRRTPLAPWDWT